MAKRDVVACGVACAGHALYRAGRMLLAMYLVLMSSPWAHAQFTLRPSETLSAAQAAVQVPSSGQPESLPALLARTLSSEPQVRVAQGLWEATIERRRQALSRLGPTLGVNVTQGKSTENEFGLPLERRTDRSDALLRWNLYNHGNDAAELRGAALDERSAAHELRRAREEAAERIAGAYLDLVRLESLLPHAAERLESVQRLVEQVRRQNALGKISDADAQQVEASLLDAEIVFQELASDHTGAVRRLAILVGARSPGALRPTVTPTLQLVVLQGAAPEMLLATGPGLVTAARERSLAARERVRPLATLLTPRIDLEMRKQLSNRTLPRLTTEQESGWSLTGSWEFPLGGELQSRQAEATRRAEAAEAEAYRLASTVSAELATLVPRIAETEHTVARLDRQIEQYNALVRAGEVQYEAGRRTTSQLIQLRDSRYNAIQRRTEQLYRLQVAKLRLLALNGSLLSTLGLAEAQTPPVR